MKMPSPKLRTVLVGAAVALALVVPTLLLVPVGSDAPAIRHVVVIVLENADASWVTGSGPYERYLASTYASATSFYGACHGSLPNYVAITSGRAPGCGSTTPVQAVANIGDLVEARGWDWAGYFEGMPTPCQTTWTNVYDPQHNPFLYYSDIVDNPSRCAAHLVNSAGFNSSVRAGTLPAYALYIPDVNNDGEYTNVTYADNWLRSLLDPVLNSTSPAVRSLVATTAFFIVYDEALNYEGYSTAGVVNAYCQGATGLPLSVCGGPVYMTLVSPFSHGGRYASDATDYNLASTVEWLLGLGSDGGYDGTSAFPPMVSLV